MAGTRRAARAGRAAWLVRSFPPGSDPAGTASPGRLRFTSLAQLPGRLEVWAWRGGPEPVLLTELSVDPELLRVDPGDPDVPGDRRWWESWDVAVRAGLAADIQLDGDPSDIDALYVVGLGDDDPADLFAAHRDAGRLALVPPGAPTNAVAGSPAADLATDPAPWLALLGRDMTEEEQQVSLALTGDAELLGPLPGDGRPHQRWAATLAAGLWPVLWGQPLGDVHDLGAVVDDLHEWAADNLEPLGPYPTLRVGAQPYGLLPATSLEDWRPAPGDPAIEEQMRPTLLTLRRHWDRAGARAGRGAIEDADADRVVDLLAQPPASPAYAVRVMHPLELWFLGLLATDHAARWPILMREWARANPLATELNLTPRRRYASRGRSRPVRLPPVTPAGLAAGQTVGDLLTGMVELARTQPQAYASIGDVERALGASTKSLLLRLAVRSLQLSLGDVGRGKLGQRRGTLEPIAARSDTAPLLTDWLQAVGPADLDDEPGPATDFKRVAQALDDVAGVPVEDLARLLPPTIDCASHRLDPWLTGLARRRLRTALAQPPVLGAYGWVERPHRGTPGPTQGGLLLAPSMSQALTAAIVRDRAVDDAEPARWHMDITSERARGAARLADEVRRGEHPAEALGREVERAVADPVLVRALRLRFPVHPDHAGRRVCDGLQVLAADPASLGLPGDVLDRLAPLRAVVDVYGDLLVAEAVHHVVEGRAAVAGAALDAAAGLGRPPVMDILQTRHEGRPVETTCVVVVRDVKAPVLPDDSERRAAVSPALLAEPAVAALLRQRVGAAARWHWTVAREVGASEVVTLADLGLEPADALALPIGELERLVLAAAGGSEPRISNKDGTQRYERAARLVAVLGRSPAGPADVADTPGGTTAPGVQADLRARLAGLRKVAQSLVDVLAAARTRDERRGALRLATRWGIAPLRDQHADDPLGDQVDRAREQLRVRLAAAPDDAVAGTLNRSQLADAIVALASPTGQLALCGRLRRDALPGLSAGDPDRRGLDATWLPFVAPVRPPLARLEAFQMTAGTAAGSGTALVPWTNRPGDQWQRDESRGRRLVAAYAPAALDLGASPPGTRLAVALLDRFAETIPDGERSAAAAVGFHAPGARAPQAILLAVPPDPDRPLDGESLVRIIDDTRALSRARMTTYNDLGDVAGLLPLPLLPAVAPMLGWLDLAME